MARCNSESEWNENWGSTPFILRLPKNLYPTLTEYDSYLVSDIDRKHMLDFVRNQGAYKPAPNWDQTIGRDNEK